MAAETSSLAFCFSFAVISASEIVFAGASRGLVCSDTHSGESFFSFSGSWSNRLT
jgi:hypothetical protein